MKPLLIACLLCCSAAVASPKADAVRVDKRARALELIADGQVFARYPIALGGQPEGPKQREGDQRTPEGHYRLDYKKADSGYYRAIHVSYPDRDDQARAHEQGVDPGGLIMIHGQRNGFGWASWLTQRFDWTDGCIAVDNDAMAAIWQAVDAGTPIEILP